MAPSSTREGIRDLIAQSIAAQGPDAKLEMNLGVAVVIQPLIEMAERIEQRLERKEARLQKMVDDPTITHADSAWMDKKLQPTEDLLESYQEMLKNIMRLPQ